MLLLLLLLFVCLAFFGFLFLIGFSLTIRNISWILPFSIQINISISNKKRFSQSLVRDSCRIEFSVSNTRRFRIVRLFEALVNLLFTQRDLGTGKQRNKKVEIPGADPGVVQSSLPNEMKIA